MMVYEIIKNYPEAANNDAILLEQVWLKEGWDETKSLYWNLSKVTKPETISRRRRELAVMGLITYSKDATKRREEAFNNERERAASVAAPKKELKAVSWLKD